jgi:hypothetical protein
MVSAEKIKMKMRESPNDSSQIEESERKNHHTQHYIFVGGWRVG